jgi:hypothetical protein
MEAGGGHASRKAVSSAVTLHSIVARKLWKKAIHTAVSSLQTADESFRGLLRHGEPLNKTLTQINLSNTGLSAEDALELADYLPSATPLSFLDLSLNKLTTSTKLGGGTHRDGDGLQALIGALHVNRTLTAVNLLGNGMDEVEARDCTELLRDHSFLQSICGIGPNSHMVHITHQGLNAADMIMLAAELDGGTDKVSFLDTNSAILLGELNYPAEEGSEGCLHEPLLRLEPESKYEVRIKRNEHSDYRKPTEVLYVHTLGRYLHFRRMLVHIDISNNNLCDPNVRGLQEFFKALAHNWTLKSLVSPPTPPTLLIAHPPASSLSCSLHFSLTLERVVEPARRSPPRPQR